MEKTSEVRPPDNSSLWWLAIVVAAMLAIGALAGCMTPEKMKGKFDHLAAKCERNKKLNAVPLDWSLKRWPLRERKTTNTVYTPGPVREVPGEKVYVTVDCDSAVKAAGANAKMTRISVPVYMRVDTQKIVQETVQEDERKLEREQLETQKWMDEASKWKLKAERSKTEKDVAVAAANGRTGVYRNWLIGAGSVLALVLVFFVAGLMGKGMNPLKWIGK
ncbi:MAG: hypothetical protein KF744_08950 [Taibaiella sp.]|nr:hypothetical protein [Taibaiella sp.]